RVSRGAKCASTLGRSYRTMSTTSTAPVPREESAAVPPGRFFTDFSGSDPIRAELLGLDNLEVQAQGLARQSHVIPGPSAGHPLLRRFTENGRHLVEAHRRIALVAQRQEPITPDAEWLLDNFHIVEDTLR